MKDIDLWIDTRQGNTVTIVTINAIMDGEIIEATGEAVRHPEDKHDPELGLLLAHARAFDSLARKLDRRAQGLVKMNDHNKEYKKRQEEKARGKELSTEEHVQAKRNKRWQGSRKKNSFRST